MQTVGTSKNSLVLAVILLWKSAPVIILNAILYVVTNRFLMTFGGSQTFGLGVMSFIQWLFIVSTLFYIHRLAGTGEKVMPWNQLKLRSFWHYVAIATAFIFVGISLSGMAFGTLVFSVAGALMHTSKGPLVWLIIFAAFITYILGFFCFLFGQTLPKVASGKPPRTWFTHRELKGSRLQLFAVTLFIIFPLYVASFWFPIFFGLYRVPYVAWEVLVVQMYLGFMIKFLPLAAFTGAYWQLSLQKEAEAALADLMSEEPTEIAKAE